MNQNHYSKYFDHTILKPDADKERVQAVIQEAIDNQFASVCVNQYRTKMVADALKETGIKTCTVVGFPLGAVDTEVKVFETQRAIADGADEIDMVINIGALKDKEYDYVLHDIQSVKEACGDRVLKVIIETCFLEDAEKKKACELAMQAGADFVKTSTGFGSGGANAEDVRLMKQIVGDKLQVKASGGIRDFETAKSMIDAGATRLGTSAIINCK
ncbi:MAG: deoxyribose-phosphate aldolase [Lachnospiraceae bacterium]|nr:deoxyribose-phosphate aldolase [Lachnospiraceae bacterium]